MREDDRQVCMTVIN